VVKVQDIMSAIDDMLREMTLEGYVLPVAQSEVVKTLKEIRSSGRLMRSHKL
jgi:tRNA A-37 threonylcarbamoyl transferase component Bud32